MYIGKHHYYKSIYVYIEIKRERLVRVDDYNNNNNNNIIYSLTVFEFYVFCQLAICERNKILTQ